MSASMKLSELCKAIADRGFPAELEGPDRTVHAVNTLEDAGENDVSFLSNPKYLGRLKTTRAGAVIVAPNVKTPPGKPVIRCPEPYAGLTIAIITIHGHRRHPSWGISPKANIDPSATVSPNAHVAPGVTVAADAVVGDGCVLYPGSYVGDRARLGRDVVLYPNVVIYDDCVLGDRVAIHAGTIIGEDGLGYAPVGPKWMKIPQVGRVVIEDDVEIGANCAIDRATLGQTMIGAGTKFSDLIAIGHGSKIGENCMIVALVGVAGSVTVGKNVTLAGQAGLAGHLTVGDGATVAGQAGIAKDVPPGAKVLGSPASDINAAKRQFFAVRKLPDWSREVNRRINELEAQVESLKSALEQKS